MTMNQKNNSGNCNTNVLGGHSVPTTLYWDVMKHMDAQMHKVKPEALNTLKGMCEIDFWDDMNSWQRRKAGRAFAHMVHTGIFPFEFVQYKRSPTKRYLLVQ